MKTVAISQSNYIPWRGYFDLIAKSDVFVLYDDMQYTRRDWRNRNKIKTSSGLSWLTIPVEVKGRYYQKINETKIADSKWSKSHWDKIRQSYKEAQYFKEIADIFEPIYLDNQHQLLSTWNKQFIEAICAYLNIETEIIDSTKFQLIEGKSERLVNLCSQLEADIYLSGPAAKNYLDQGVFQQMGISVEWANYDGYPTYSQLHGDFDSFVSIIDLLFNHGKRATNFMKYCK